MADNEKYFPLSECRKADNIHKELFTRYLVACKDARSYLLPKCVTIECYPEDTHSCCESCPEGKKEFKIAATSDEFVGMLTQSKEGILETIKRLCGFTHPKCRAKVEIIEFQNVEKVIICPEILSRDGALVEHCETEAINTGCGMQTNTSYASNIYTIVSPGRSRNNSPYAVHILSDAIKLRNASEDFVMTPIRREKLKPFQCEPNAKAIIKKLKNIAKSLSAVTHIVERNDIHILVDLVYHSPLEFSLGTTYIPRGWLDAAIIGDRTEGKSNAIRGMLNLYGLGEFCSGIMSTSVGLIGGIAYRDTRASVRWGIVPLNAGGLVVLDEVCSNKPAMIESLREARSSGRVRIDKADVHGEADARTRLLWVSNPYKDKTVADYAYGVTAVFEIFHTPMDIRRLDLLLIVAKGEVSDESKNRGVSSDIQLIAQKEAFKTRVLWAWSLRAGKVQFTSAAEDAIRHKYALELSQTYSNKLPIIDDMCTKLARVSAAVAACVCSTDDSGKLIIEFGHVEAGFTLINYFYEKPSCAYDKYSKRMQAQEKLTDVNFAKQLLESIAPKIRTKFFGNIHQQEEITVEDIQNWMMTDNIERAKEFVRHAVSLNAFRRYQRGYRKTQEFIRFLDDYLLQGEEE